MYGQMHHRISKLIWLTVHFQVLLDNMLEWSPKSFWHVEATCGPSFPSPCTHYPLSNLSCTQTLIPIGVTLNMELFHHIFLKSIKSIAILFWSIIFELSIIHNLPLGLLIPLSIWLACIPGAPHSFLNNTMCGVHGGPILFMWGWLEKPALVLKITPLLWNPTWFMPIGVGEMD